MRIRLHTKNWPQQKKKVIQSLLKPEFVESIFPYLGSLRILKR